MLINSLCKSTDQQSSLYCMEYIGSLVELILVIMQELEAELLSIPRLDVVDDGRLAMR